MNDIVKRLTRQLASKGVKNAAGVAIGLQKKAGNLDSKGKLTDKGKKRSAMGNAGRAKDRAAKASGHKAKDYTYDPKTNSSKLKRK